MSRIFLIPGLGADVRIYQNLTFDQQYEVVFVKWIEPELSDTLASYAGKLIRHYEIKAGEIVIGNSLGGMLAVEMGKLVQLKKIILISSIRTVEEAPEYFRFFRNLPIYKVIPESTISSLDFLLELFFGNVHKADRALFVDMLKNWQPGFLKWAINAIVNWDNKTIPENTIVITGDKDLVFSHKKTRDAIIVKGGTHIMVFDMAIEINKILHELLLK